MSIIPKELHTLVATDEKNGKHLVVESSSSSTATVIVDAGGSIRVTVPRSNVETVERHAFEKGAIWVLDDKYDVTSIIPPAKPAKPAKEQTSTSHRGCANQKQLGLS